MYYYSHVYTNHPAFSSMIFLTNLNLLLSLAVIIVPAVTAVLAVLAIMNTSKIWSLQSVPIVLP